MRIKFSFSKDQVVQAGVQGSEQFIEIEYDPRRHPEPPCFVITNAEQPQEKRHGYHIAVTERGAVKASKYD